MLVWESGDLAKAVLLGWYFIYGFKGVGFVLVYIVLTVELYGNTLVVTNKI